MGWVSGAGECALKLILFDFGGDKLTSVCLQMPKGEGQIYGGIFVEDSSGGCVSL